jgi:hypothetical protein
MKVYTFENSRRTPSGLRLTGWQTLAQSTNRKSITGPS